MFFFLALYLVFFFFFSSRRRHTRFKCDWSSDVCSSDLPLVSLSNTKGFGSCSSGGSMTWSNWSVCAPNRDNTGFNPASCTQTVGNGTANCGTANASGLTGPASSQMPQFYYSTSDWASPYTIVNESSGSCSTIATDIGN